MKLVRITLYAAFPDYSVVSTERIKDILLDELVEGCYAEVAQGIIEEFEVPVEDPDENDSHAYQTWKEEARAEMDHLKPAVMFIGEVGS
jgi:hypothetical protein